MTKIKGRATTRLAAKKAKQGIGEATGSDRLKGEGRDPGSEGARAQKAIGDASRDRTPRTKRRPRRQNHLIDVRYEGAGPVSCRLLVALLLHLPASGGEVE